MFGTSTLNEITRNLLPLNHNVALNAVLTYLMVLIPLTKFALLMEPVSKTVAQGLRNLVARSKALSPEEPASPTGSAASATPTPLPGWLQSFVKTGLSALALGISVLFPKFEAILALLGTLFSSSVSIVFPAACFIKMYGSGEDAKGKLEIGVAWLVLLFGLGVASAGTVVSVIEAIG
jgi:vesicular inhibitory amino acid transporter